MTVKVLHLELDGYRSWKTVKLHDITLPEFSVPAVIQYLNELYPDEELFLTKGDFSLTCKGRVINYMGEETGSQFILVS